MATGNTLLVLHGASAARPDELDTLTQAAAVAAALCRLGWRADVRALGPDLRALDRSLSRLLSPAPAVVFNLVEALGGESRHCDVVPAALARLKVPFTGATAGALRDTTDKTVAKTRLVAAGLPTPAWAEGTAADPAACYIVKPVSEDASLGLDAGCVVPAGRVGDEIARRRSRFGGDWFAERYIDGREFNVSLLAGPAGLEPLPPAEILFVDFPAERPRIVDYEAKWDIDSDAYRRTPRRFDMPAGDGALLGELVRLALAAARLFGLDSYARVDFRVDADGRPWILEVNANPCLAPDAGFIAAAGRAGLAFDQVVARILAGATASRRAAA